MACGYAGVENLKVENLAPALKTKLIAQLEKLFNEESAKAITNYDDVPYFPVLIYNKSYNFKNYPAGLKFNENWDTDQTERAKAEHAVDDRPRKKSLRLLEDTHSRTIPALKVKNMPDIIDGFGGYESPVSIAGDEIKFAILVNSKSGNLEEIASQKANRSVVIVADQVFRIDYEGSNLNAYLVLLIGLGLVILGVFLRKRTKLIGYSLIIVGGLIFSCWLFLVTGVIQIIEP